MIISKEYSNDLPPLTFMESHKEEGFAVLLSDSPITNHNDDDFGRAEFAEHLASYLRQMAKEPTCVVALRGKWGSGKTSLINLTLNKLRESEKKPIIVLFNPWTCVSTDRLVVDFLHALRNGLAKSLTTEKARSMVDKALQAIERYATALAPLDIAVQLSGLPFSSAGTAEKTASSLRAMMMEGDDVDTCKRKVSEELELAFENVIVVIDDIDRLPNDKICLLFQLIAQIADFPHVHYLLAYDANIVERAIGTLQGDNGRAYLEKIVQLSIDVPEIPRSVLDKTVRDYLNPILDQFNVSEESSEALRANRVIAHAVVSNVKTMRDYKLFHNAFEFELAYVGSDISIVDLIALVALKQFSPEAISWIDTHSSLICGLGKNSFVPSEAAEFKNAEIESMSSTIGNNRSKAESIIETLMDIFPRFACECGEFSEVVTIQDLKMAGRVASEEVYMRYRLASLGSWGYPREAIRTLLDNAPRDEIALVLDSGLANGFDFAQEAEGLIQSIPPERAIEIAGGILDSISKSRETDEYSSRGDTLERMLRNLLAVCGHNNASTLLHDMIVRSSPEGLIRISHLINTEELAHGRLAGSGEIPHRQLLDLDDLLHLEGVYARCVKEVSKDCNLLSLQGSSMLLYLWGCFDRQTEDDYINRMLTEDECNLVYICQLCVGVWRSVNGIRGGTITGWSPSRNKCERYLNTETLCESINRIRFKPSFWDKDETTLQATTAMYLMTERGIPDSDDPTTLEISQTEVTEILNMWRDEYEEGEN